MMRTKSLSAGQNKMILCSNWRRALFAIALFTLANSSQSFAQGGWFSDFVLVSVNDAGTQYKWIGSNPSFGSEFAGSTFTVTYGQTVKLGADMKYWASNGSRDGGAIYWRIGTSGGWTEEIWAQTHLGGNDYQGKIDPPSKVVTGGLNVGTHTLQVYAKSWGSGGDIFLSNSGNNYSATIVINKANQSAVTGTLGSTAITYGSTTTVTAAGGSGDGAYEFRQNGGTGAVTFSGSGASRTINATTAGTAIIEVRRLGNTNHNDSSWGSAGTLTINKANQATVNGSLSANSVSINSTVTATASGGSGTGAYEFRQTGGTAGAVTFASTGNPRTITGAVAGTAPVEVRRVGDTNYNDSVWVSAGTLTVSAAATIPAVSNGAATSVAQNTATLAGEVTGDGGATVSERGFVYSTSDSTPTIAEVATKETTTGTTGAMSKGISSLTANTTYYYNAYASNSVGISYGAASSFTTLPNAPSAPATPSGGSVTTTGFTVSWTAVSGAVDYRLDVSTASNFAINLTGYNDLTVSGTSQSVSGLTAGTTYYVRVRAVNTGGTSASSSTLTQITVPAQAATPTASSVAAYSFTANWTATTGAAGYLLDVSTNSAFSSFITGYNALSVSGTNQSVTGLSSATTYYARVRRIREARAPTRPHLPKPLSPFLVA
jgi:hypothetical protein